MNVELKFKPGVRTSLNSSSNIRDNFSADSKKSGQVVQTRNSTAASATANLSKMSLSSGDWSSKQGSILNGNTTPTRTYNSTSRSSSGGVTSSSKSSPSQGTRVAHNYVSAGRTQQYQRNKYTGNYDFGYTRSVNTTGYGGRALQRLQDVAYGTGEYSVQTQDNDGPSKLEKAVAIGTGIIGAVGLGVAIWNAFSKSDTDDTGTTDGKTTGKVSADATASIDNMKSADSSATLSAAINNSTANCAAVRTSKTELEGEPKKAQEEQPKLETDLKTAQDNYNNLDTQVKNQTEILNQNTKALPAAQTSYESAKSAYESAPDEPANEKAQLKDAMDAAEKNLKTIQQKIEEAKAQLEQLNPQLTEAKGKLDDAQEAVNTNKKTIEETPAKIADADATIAAYEAEIPKQKDRLTKMTAKETEKLAELQKDAGELEKEVQQLKNEGKTEKAEKKEKELQEVNAQKTALQEQADIRSLDDVQYSGGHEFKKGTDSNGMPIFVIDGKKVTEEEYNKQLNPQGEEAKAE